MPVAVPGAELAATVAYAMVDELIDTLIARNVLPAYEKVAMAKRICARLEKSVQTASKNAAEFVRNRMIPLE